jgi:hypothetical protein
MVIAANGRTATPQPTPPCYRITALPNSASRATFIPIYAHAAGSLEIGVTDPNPGGQELHD